MIGYLIAGIILFAAAALGTAIANRRRLHNRADEPYPPGYRTDDETWRQGFR